MIKHKKTKVFEHVLTQKTTKPSTYCPYCNTLLKDKFLKVSDETKRIKIKVCENCGYGEIYEIVDQSK